MKNELSDLIKKFSLHYIEESRKPFHATANTQLLTKEIPELIKDTLSLGDEYKIYASVGSGNWSEIPWVAILDKSITTSTREGYYVVILFDKYLKNIYLCLSAGWTQFEREFGIKDGRDHIVSTCSHYGKLLESCPIGFLEGTIDLNAQNTLGKGYEAGSIMAKKYKISSLEGSILFNDIKELLFSYKELRDIVGDSILNLEVDASSLSNTVKDFKKKVARESFSKDTGSSLKKLIEAANEAPPDIRTKLKKEIVRNKKFASLIKEKANYICELCGRPPFIQKNGKLYAEADHIIPLGSDTKGLDSPDNMRCLCPLCHAVITHGSAEEIKKLIV